MSKQVFASHNPPLPAVLESSEARPINGICVGLICEWARKVLGGTPMSDSKPRERPARDLAAAARLWQVDRWKRGKPAADWQDAWEGGLAQVGLQPTALATGSMNGPQLLGYLCQVIPPGGLCAVSIARPGPPNVPVVYHGVAFMRQHPGMEPGPLLLFDPGFGLYQCDDAADFAKTTEYLTAYTQPAWAYAIHPRAVMGNSQYF